MLCESFACHHVPWAECDLESLVHILILALQVEELLHDVTLDHAKLRCLGARYQILAIV